MPITFNSWNPASWTFTRYSNGDTLTSQNELITDFSSSKNKLKSTLDNYAVFTSLKIITDICSQARFFIEAGDSKKDSDPLLDLLQKPNYLQSQKDFIKEWLWFKLTHGYVVQHPIFPSAHERTPENTEAIYNLNTAFIKFGNNFKTPMLFTQEDIDNFSEQKIIYKVSENQEKEFEVKELLFTYDVVNGLKNDFLLSSPSRLDALTKSISNINIALSAENMMLQTNGRELFSGGVNKGQASGVVMPMDKADRIEIQNKLINVYGFSKGKVRSIVTKQGINWQSLHIALKDLGLHESAVKNAATIRAAFQIPETVYKLYLEKGDTFENKREGEVEFIQNVAQNHMDDFCDTLTKFYGYEDTPLRASFDHLPAMKHIEERKAETLLKISASVRNLQQAGFSSEQIQSMIADAGFKEFM